MMPKGNYDYKGGDGGGFFHANLDDIEHHLPSIGPNFSTNKMQPKEFSKQISSRTLTSIPQIVQNRPPSGNFSPSMKQKQPDFINHRSLIPPKMPAF